MQQSTDIGNEVLPDLKMYQMMYVKVDYPKKLQLEFPRN